MIETIPKKKAESPSTRKSKETAEKRVPKVKKIPCPLKRTLAAVMSPKSDASKAARCANVPAAFPLSAYIRLRNTDPTPPMKKSAMMESMLVGELKKSIGFIRANQLLCFRLLEKSEEEPLRRPSVMADLLES